MSRYLIFNPDQPGIVWAEVSKDGDTENVILHNIIQAMRRGKFTAKGYALLCVPNTRNRYGSLTAKKKDCVRLGELFVPKKNRGSNIGLAKIREQNRFKGRDWNRDRSNIRKQITSGTSISKIAKSLGVSPSALSKANKQHNLYSPQQPPC